MAPKRPKRPVETTLGTASTRDEEPVDESILQRPIETSVFGLRQVLTLFTTATDEVKEYVTAECDILYECRVCRSLFRSLANFVLHKRKYCTEKYFGRMRTCVDEHDDDDYEEATATPIPTPPYTTSPDGTPLDDIVRRLKDKQDIDRLIDEMKDEDLSRERADAKRTGSAAPGEPERIESNDHAVFQSGMKSEVMEICDILDNNEAIIGPDGKWRAASARTRPMRCKECGQVFATRKTLTYHVKYKHNGSRLVYACPDCDETYATAWSVYRHLHNFHKKSMPQIRKLRSQICNNAIRRDEGSPRKRRDAEPERPENAKDDVENQWLADIETDSYFQMCGGCGKRFERKAALQSHTHTCLKRQQVCQSIENSKRRAGEENNNVNDKREQPSKPTKSGSAKRKPDATSRRRVGAAQVGAATAAAVAAPPDDAVPDKDEVFDIIGYARESPAPATAAVSTFDRFEPSPDRLLRRSFPYIDERALTCLGCPSSEAPPPYAKLADLLRHMSRHFLWYRFQCRLCTYVSYDQSDCEGHAAQAHDGASTVLPLPQWKSEVVARKRCGTIVGDADPSAAATGYWSLEGAGCDDDDDEEEEEGEERAAYGGCANDDNNEEEEEEEEEVDSPNPEVIVIDDTTSDEEPASSPVTDERGGNVGAAQEEVVDSPPPPTTVGCITTAQEAKDTTDGVPRSYTAAIDLDPSADDCDDRHTLELPAYHYIEPCRYDSPSPGDLKRDDFVEGCCLDESWEQAEPERLELVVELPKPTPSPPDRPRRTVKRSAKVRLEDFEYDLAVLNRALRQPGVVRPKRARRPKAAVSKRTE